MIMKVCNFPTKAQVHSDLKTTGSFVTLGSKICSKNIESVQTPCVVFSERIHPPRRNVVIFNHIWLSGGLVKVFFKFFLTKSQENVVIVVCSQWVYWSDCNIYSHVPTVPEIHSNHWAGGCLNNSKATQATSSRNKTAYFRRYHKSMYCRIEKKLKLLSSRRAESIKARQAFEVWDWIFLSVSIAYCHSAQSGREELFSIRTRQSNRDE